MQENKSSWNTILRVLTVYKKAMLIGLFLGISLVIAAVLVGQVIGNEDKSKVFTVEKGIQYTKQSQALTQEQTQEQTSPYKPTPSEQLGASHVEPDYLEQYFEPVSSFKKDRFTVLLVGVDRRPGDKSLSNTDTLLVASVNTVNGKVALLSIPRDTQVNVPGFGKGKINAAARVGKGIKTTTALIEDLIGQSIDGHVLAHRAWPKTSRSERCIAKFRTCY